MSIDDLPSVKHFKQQMDGMGIILKINKLLRCFGMGSKKIADIQDQYDAMRKQLYELKGYPTRFNRYFAEDGWLSHDSLSFDVLKQAVDNYESKGKDEAVKILLDYYSPLNVEKRILFFQAVEALRIRKKFIDYALAEDKAGRYYAAIPLLLMIIDGAVNDAIGKGFHSDKICLDVWDSVMMADGAIHNIKEIFQKGRRKTCTDLITLPYRNGILHGMDLEYDNPVVTAKCWCFLFVVRDWLLLKKSETARKKAFEIETHTPSLREIMEQLRQTQLLREAVEAWKPRKVSPEYIGSLSRNLSAEEKLPEGTVLRCLALWKKRNYGDMSKLFWSEIKISPGEVREQYGHLSISDYAILRISDEAPVITEIDVRVDEPGATVKNLCFRLIHEDENGKPVPMSFKGGNWRIVWIHTTKREG